ncbi:hypothetical protein [Streptomyces cinerochromogenes]|uniref:hypothetical protein n=1 Tax=Streptomyces cinerochromogenes TaxID=66422 RepID=UPI0016711824|nr:hypothetical protein [Streptomyces cinerochromogenes]GGS80925.1 hypothetical protein GCM10010206_49400 [Streptomyces cinerochromogenes]
MTGLLAEVGKKFAERWLTLLVLPGVLYVCAVAAARRLKGFDVASLAGRVETLAPRDNASALVYMVVLGVAAATVGLAASAVGSLVERLWLAEGWQSWPRPLRALALLRVSARQRRWDDAHRVEGALRERYLSGRIPGNPPSGVSELDLDLALSRVLATAQERPARPTWMGDRVQAVVTRYRQECGLDLPSVWPFLWLMLPDQARTEIREARERITRATTLAGWAVLYTAVAVLWWPASVVVAGLFVTARQRGRRAVETYAVLVEAATRLHAPELARGLGLDHHGPLDARTGRAMTLLVQGQSHVIPLTVGWPQPRQPV